MKSPLSRVAIVCSITSAIAGVSVARAQVPRPGPDMVLVRPTTKSADQVADAVKTYADGKKWVYLGANKVKKGEVTLVKVCIPAVGQMIWDVGLELSALLPCGNLGVYQKSGRTEISMLDPRYMQLLYPNPQVEKASAMAATQLTEMLDAVAK
jgi:Domain of unknown function DUF302